MAYIGNDPSNRFVASQAATRFSGDGSTKVFTLEHSVASDEDILVSVDGVIQEPSISYVVSSGTTLTFQGTDAPSNGTNNIFVCYLFRTVGTVSHPSNNALSATTGTFTGDVTIGDASAADKKILFDGNAQDFHIGLDDSSDSLTIGLGSTLGTTSHMIFDANGHITKPLQSCFFVGKSSSATQENIAINSNVTVTFDTEIIDQNSDFSSNTFTAPVTGRYFLTTNIRINGDSAATYYYVRLVTSNRNVGTIFDPDFGQDFSYWTLSVSSVVDMDAGDTAHVDIHQSAGTQQADIDNNEIWTNFSGYLVA